MKTINTVQEVSDRNYAHCKACDKSFYPVWRADVQQYEDLCSKCLSTALVAARTNNPRESEDTRFTLGYVEDKFIEVSDDPYYEYGEDAFGDPGLFDKY